MLTDSPAWHSISNRSAASSRRTTASPSIAVVRADGTPHTSLVNAGVLDHPRTAEPVVGYVTYGKVKLRNLRDRPATSILWRAGWQWAGVDGPSELIGPGDTDAESLRLLLRAVFSRVRRHPRRLGHLRPRHAGGGPGRGARHPDTGLRQRLSERRTACPAAPPDRRATRPTHGRQSPWRRSPATCSHSRASDPRGEHVGGERVTGEGVTVGEHRVAGVLGDQVGVDRRAGDRAGRGGRDDLGA